MARSQPEQRTDNGVRRDEEDSAEQQPVEDHRPITTPDEGVNGGDDSR
jgi:hypothetical protein